VLVADDQRVRIPSLVAGREVQTITVPVTIPRFTAAVSAAIGRSTAAAA